MYLAFIVYFCTLFIYKCKYYSLYKTTNIYKMSIGLFFFAKFFSCVNKIIFESNKKFTSSGEKYKLLKEAS